MVVKMGVIRLCNHNNMTWSSLPRASGTIINVVKTHVMINATARKIAQTVSLLVNLVFIADMEGLVSEETGGSRNQGDPDDNTCARPVKQETDTATEDD
jgi:hypothetical protein